MRAVDTNILVRLFADDDAEQAELAEQVLASDTIFLPKTVILEFEWIMRSIYREPRAAIAVAIQRLLETMNFQVEDQATVARAVNWFGQGMDFSDALHLASSTHVDDFVTFDLAMRRRSAELGTKPPVVA